MNKTELKATDVRNASKAALARFKEMGVQVSHAQVLEAFAGAFGHANWHVMKQQLPKKAKKFAVRNKVTLYLETYFILECDPGFLSWVGVTLTEQFMAELLRLQAAAKETNSSVTVAEWPSELSDEEYIKHSHLVVTETDFWFEMRDKYSNGHYEFPAFSIDLAKQLVSRKKFEDCSHPWIDLQFPPSNQDTAVVIVGDENSVLFDDLVEAGVLPSKGESTSES